MPRIVRDADVVWEGNLARGAGAISAASSGAFSSLPYSLPTRIGGSPDKTSPEELLAAAHGGCFTMSLAAVLGGAGLVAQHMATTAEVTLESVDGGFAITAVHLVLRARIDGTDQATFERMVAVAEANCPVSKLLKAAITFDAALLD